MFAFVLWDAKNKRMFGARDIFGIKPFYYYPVPDGSGLVFGSEIKAFLEHPKFVKAVNENALRPYLTLQYSATEETFFKGVYKLPAAHYFVYENGKMDVRRFWDCEFDPQPQNFEACADKLDEVVHESVAAHRIADVKVGSFLSGGVDSSYIAAVLMPDTTFSVGFDYNQIQRDELRGRAFGQAWHPQPRQAHHGGRMLRRFPGHPVPHGRAAVEPVQRAAVFPGAAGPGGSDGGSLGEGADEIFAGYEWYADTPAMEKFKRLPLGVRRAAAAAAKKLPYFKGKNFLLKCSERPEDYFFGQALVFPEDEASAVLQPTYDNGRWLMSWPRRSTPVSKDKMK